jgi:hypothetical protein
VIKIKHTLAVATLALMTAAALPALAADQAPTAAAAAPGPAKAPHHPTRADAVEARIKDLHDKLKITDAQADQWAAVAQVMRDNANGYAQLIKDTKKAEATTTAVEDLQAYQRVAEAHAEGIKKLAATFETLYDTMSPEQKKITDEVFRAHKHHHAGKAQ